MTPELTQQLATSVVELTNRALQTNENNFNTALANIQAQVTALQKVHHVTTSSPNPPTGALATVAASSSMGEPAASVVAMDLSTGNKRKDVGGAEGGEDVGDHVLS